MARKIGSFKVYEATVMEKFEIAEEDFWDSETIKVMARCVDLMIEELGIEILNPILPGEVLKTKAFVSW